VARILLFEEFEENSKSREHLARLRVTTVRGSCRRIKKNPLANHERTRYCRNNNNNNNNNNTTKLWKVPRDTSASAASAARHRELYIVPPAVVIVVELFSLCASRLSGNGKTSDNASHRLAPSPPNIEEIVPIVLIVRRRSCFAYRGRKQPRSTRTQVRFLSRPCYSTFVLSRGTAARGTSLHVERRVRVPLLRGPRIDDFGGTERTSPLSQATSTCNFWPRKRIGLLIKLTLAPTRIATGLDNSSV
jgi:hypothetical protein